MREGHGEAIVRALKQPLLVLDAELCVRTANPAYRELFQRDADDLVGRRLTELRHWSSAKVQQLLSEVASGARPTCEFELEHDTGAPGLRTLLVDARAFSPDGAGPALLVTLEDVTERRRTESERNEAFAELEEGAQQLQSINRELDGFTHSVSHDLRAPLRAIDGFGKILLEEHASALGPDGERLVGVIRKNTQKMGQLIDDLLAFSRLGRHPFRAEQVDMTRLARDVATELLELEPARRVKLVVEDLPAASCDRALVRQVWCNLIGNALKYSRGRAEATIRVRGVAAAAERCYSVEDDGVGFDMRYAHKLFGVFQRLHSNSDFEGTGVGLALVDRIVRRHGGRVWAESRPGEGATFHFALPTEA